MARLLIVIGLFGAVAIATPVVALEPICSSPAVIFCEDWETTALPGRWVDGDNPSLHSITTNPANVYRGTHALEVVWAGDGGWLTSWLNATGAVPSGPFQGYDHTFVRYYWKISANWQCWPSNGTCGKQIVQYGLQTGTNGPFNPWSGLGQAGQCPTGSDWYYAGVATYMRSGIGRNIMLYSYFPNMDPQCPNSFGVFSPSGVQLPLNQWVCMEEEVHANTPGQTDGLQRLWMNDTLIREVTGMRWRDTTNLQTGALQLTFSGGPNQGAQYSWVDNIVVSTQRIGCGVGTSAVPSNQTKRPAELVAKRQVRAWGAHERVAVKR
jgi:hypothetical protein